VVFNLFQTVPSLSLSLSVSGSLGAAQVVLKPSQWFGKLGRLNLEKFAYVFGSVYPCVLTIIPLAAGQIRHYPGASFTIVNEKEWQWPFLFGPLTASVVLGGAMLGTIFWKLIVVSGPRGLLRYARLLTATVTILIIMFFPPAFRVYTHIKEKAVAKSFEEWVTCTSEAGALGVPEEKSGCSLKESLSFPFNLLVTICAPAGTLAVCFLLGINSENMKGLRRLAARLHLVSSPGSDSITPSTSNEQSTTFVASNHSTHSNHSADEVPSPRIRRRPLVLTLCAERG
jgi:hypothetical protein